MKKTILFNSCYKSVKNTDAKIKSTLSKINDFLRNQKGSMSDYGFITGCTKIYDDSNEDDIVARQFLLSSYTQSANPFANENKRNLIFTLFYLVCLHHYRQKDTKTLYYLLNTYVGNGNKRFSLKDYPIIWDLCCRYAVIENNYNEIIASALAGKSSTNDNIAFRVSYISAVLLRSNDLYYKTAVKEGERKSLPSFISHKLSIRKNKYEHEATLKKAIEFVCQVIEVNHDYDKYYFQLAQLIFYAHAYLESVKESEKPKYIDSIDEELKRVSTLSVWKEINGEYQDSVHIDNKKTMKPIIEFLINSASKKAKSDERKAEYDQFSDVVKCYFDNRSRKLFEEKNRIIKSTSFESCPSSSMLKSSESKNYITISYSRKDYKSVLCDIIELKNLGVQIVYDECLSKKDDSDGETWHQKYLAIMKKSEAVLCYMSENYLGSKAVRKELKMINENHKKAIMIDLTGKKTISEIIEEVITQNTGDRLDSETIRNAVTIFDDDKLVFPKKKNPDSVSHIDSLYGYLNTQCPTAVKNCVASSAFESNSASHPLEDAFICDDENKIYIVADGITRQEGYTDKKYSLVKEFTDAFCDLLHKNLTEELRRSPDFKESMFDSFITSSKLAKNNVEEDQKYKESLASAKIKAQKKGVYWEPVGCVTAFVAISNSVLYYGGVGDCAVFLVRDGQLITLTNSQTYHAFKIDKVEKNRELLYEKYVNIPENPYGYGVANGDENVACFLKVASIKLQEGDAIFLMSDGVADFFHDTFRADYASISAKELLKEQIDTAPKNQVFDDRTIIKIEYM